MTVTLEGVFCSSSRARLFCGANSPLETIFFFQFSCRGFIDSSNVYGSTFLKKNQTTPRPSEHPPVMGGKMSKRCVLSGSRCRRALRACLMPASTLPRYFSPSRLPQQKKISDVIKGRTSCSLRSSKFHVSVSWGSLE